MAKFNVKLHCSTVEVDEANTEAIMRQNSTHFFSKPHGKRETYTVYRGCMIVRNTVQYSVDRWPTRNTVVYLFTLDLEGSPNFFCLATSGEVKSVRQAKRLIDKVLELGSIHEDGKRLPV